MRVLLVSGSQPHVPCGVGDYTHRLAEHLASLGVSVSILTTKDDRLDPESSVQVIAAPAGWRLRDMPGLLRRIRRLHPDVVHLQYPAVGYGRGFGATFLPVASEVMDRGVVSATTLHEFRRLAPRHRARVALGAAASRLVVVPDIDEVDVVRRALPPIRRRRLLHIPVAGNIPVSTADGARQAGGALRIGHWGFLRPDKGVDDLIDAAAILSRQRDIRLILAGDPGPDADYIRTIRERVAARGLAPVTSFGSWSPASSLSALLRQFDVCVLPFRDGLATNRGTYASAVEHGLHVVTTSTVQRPPDMARRTWFAPPGDPERLADAIQAAGDHPPIELPIASVTWRGIAEAHLEAYGDLTRSRPQGASAG